jgi:hypothetical protein
MRLNIKIFIFQIIPNIHTISYSLVTEKMAKFSDIANILSMWESNI